MDRTPNKNLRIEKDCRKMLMLLSSVDYPTNDDQRNALITLADRLEYLYARQRCPLCGGTGDEGHHKFEQCSRCDGSGGVTLDLDELGCLSVRSLGTPKRASGARARAGCRLGTPKRTPPQRTPSHYGARTATS